MLKFQGRWYWCDLCGLASLICETCGLNSCSCGSNECCSEDFHTWAAMTPEECPQREEIPHTREQCVEFFEALDRKRGMTEEEILEKRRQYEEAEKLWDQDRSDPM